MLCGGFDFDLYVWERKKILPHSYVLSLRPVN